MRAKEFRGSATELYILRLRGGIAVGLVLAGIADDVGGVQAMFYSATKIFSGLLTIGYALYQKRGTGLRLVVVDKASGHLSVRCSSRNL